MKLTFVTPRSGIEQEINVSTESAFDCQGIKYRAVLGSCKNQHSWLVVQSLEKPNGEQTVYTAKMDGQSLSIENPYSDILSPLVRPQPDHIHVNYVRGGQPEVALSTEGTVFRKIFPLSDCRANLLGQPVAAPLNFPNLIR